MGMVPRMSLNQQPSETIVRDDGSELDIINVFRTIQGEGPFTGYPAVFVRLAGCNLQCPNCDTEYTKGRNKKAVSVVIYDIHNASFFTDAKLQTKLVVITGGEPFRQNITPLVNHLLLSRFTIQIETNGTIFREDFPYHRCTVVCSPKTARIHSSLQDNNRIYNLKYVIKAGEVDENDFLPTTVLGKEVRVQRPWKGFQGEVRVSPEDSGDKLQNEKNVDLVKQAALKCGYIAGVQLHKILGVD